MRDEKWVLRQLAICVSLHSPETKIAGTLEAGHARVALEYALALVERTEQLEQAHTMLLALLRDLRAGRTDVEHLQLVLDGVEQALVGE